MNSSFPRAASLLPTLRQSQARARGFSLLEVAIALVIFVFGALAIVRIFPGALRVITVGGSRQNALNLNRATMARVQLNPPAATYDVGPMGTSWQDGYPGDNTVTPNIPPGSRAVLGSTNRGYSLPRSSNLQDYDVSALGSIRAVVGEGTTVKATDEATPKFFILTQFPIYDIDGNYGVTLVEKGRLNGVTIDADGKLDFTNATWADSNAPFSPVASEDFDVSFRYQRNANVWGVTDYPATVTTNTVTTAKISPPFGTTSPAIYPIVAGQVEVTCKNKLGSPFASIPTENDLERGFIDITKNTTNLLMQGSGVATPLVPGDKIFVDYQADWSRMLQEGIADTVPERSTPTTARQIALGAPFIEDNAINTILTLSYKKDAATPGKYVGIKGCWGEGGLVPDNDTSLTTTSSAYTGDLPKLLSPINSDPNVRTPKADLRASRVTFDIGTSQGFTSRVSYRTSDQWSQQLSVAADSYKPFVTPPTGSLPIEPWRDYDFVESTLFFHASDAGKSVMVTYTYTRDPIDPNSPKITLRNRLLSIRDDPEQGNVAGLTSGFSDANHYVARLQLTDADGNDLSASQLLSISGVRGASVTVRTAWLDGSRYTQSFLTAMRAGTGAEAMP